MDEVTDTNTKGTFKVYRQQNIVVCEFEGDLTETLLEESQKKIEDATHKGSMTRGIIIDTMKIKPVGIDIAKRIQQLQETFLKSASRVAMVTVDASVAYKSKRAFKENESHRVFYNDRGGATRWMLS
jgi:MFS superfamily sulfate permease-like transporter